MAFPDAYDTALLAFSPNAYWPCDDPPGGTSNGAATPTQCIREASGLWTGDTNLWWPYISALDGTLGNPSLLPLGGVTGGTCFQKAGTGSLALNWTGLSAGEKAVAAPSAPMTFCCWFNPTNVVGGDAAGNGHSGLYGQFGGYNAGLNWESAVIGGIGAPSARVVVPSNTYMIAHTYDGASSILYINGVSQGVVATSAAVQSAAINVELCGLLNAGSLVGYIQKIALIPAALTAAQIQSLYVIGAMSVSEANGQSFNVYPFSRQIRPSNTQRKTITFTNPSDTPIFYALGAGPAAVNAGGYVAPNGATQTITGWTGAIQVISASLFGAKQLLYQET